MFKRYSDFFLNFLYLIYFLRYLSGIISFGPITKLIGSPLSILTSSPRSVYRDTTWFPWSLIMESTVLLKSSYFKNSSNLSSKYLTTSVVASWA